MVTKESVRGLRSPSQVFRKVAHLSRPDLDVEVVPLVGDLEDLGPGEAVDAQSVTVDEETGGAHAQHNLHSLRILRRETRHSQTLIRSMHTHTHTLTHTHRHTHTHTLSHTHRLTHTHTHTDRHTHTLSHTHTLTHPHTHTQTDTHTHTHTHTHTLTHTHRHTHSHTHTHTH